jgi:WD40 repeat protein
MSELERLRAALVCAAVFSAALALDARGAEPADTPAGLSIVWRMLGRKIERGATGGVLNAFSPDGRYLAIHDSRRVRVVEARNGKSVRDFRLDPSSVEPFSLAVSSTGDVALGLMGNAEVFSAGKDAVRHWCVGACGAITSVAFSPDERFLAFQGTRGLPEWRSGLGGVVSVVDLERGEPVNLDAVASIAHVDFSPDGESFCAMSVTQLDDRQNFGVRVWSTADWSLTRNIIGSKRTMRRVAPLGSVPYAGVSMNEGRIEARDLATDRVLWSVPLVPPDVDGAPGAPESANLDLVEIAPTAAFVLSYEAPKAYDATGQAKGVIVIRRAADGEVEALYDVPRVSDLTIAPDGKTFAYSTATGQTYTAVARVPL